MMISKLAEKAAHYYVDKNLIEESQIMIYKYGFELLISTLVSMIAIACISIGLGISIGSFVFLLAFIPLRQTAGGYHAKHHWSCILGFAFIFLLSSITLNYMNPAYLLHYSLIAVMISSILVWSFAPVEASNKPLKAHAKEKQRKRSITLSNLNLTIVLLAYAFHNIPINLLAFYATGALIAGVLLVAAKMPLHHYANTVQINKL